MRTLLLCLALPLLTWGADDDAWAKLRDVKSGAEIRVYKIGAAQPLAVKMGELTDENLVIIDKNKQWKLNNEDTNPDRLPDRLIEVFKTRAEKVVFVKGDPDLDFATVARAIDIAHGAGIDKVGLMTPKVEEGR